jgi:hypothetical protein
MEASSSFRYHYVGGFAENTATAYTSSSGSVNRIVPDSIV